MIWHVEGIFTELTPAFAVIDCHGVGYGVHISLQTYEKMKGSKAGRLLTYMHVSEDKQDLYGFAEDQERKMFRMLTSVNGVGNMTAMLILSALTTKDIYNTIVHDNISVLKSIKGIGEKTAHRIVLELKDKLIKDGSISSGSSMLGQKATPHREAEDALIALGFSRLAIEKALGKVAAAAPQDVSVEDLIKQTLKIL